MLGAGFESRRARNTFLAEPVPTTSQGMGALLLVGGIQRPSVLGGRLRRRTTGSALVCWAFYQPIGAEIAGLRDRGGRVGWHFIYT